MTNLKLIGWRKLLKIKKFHYTPPRGGYQAAIGCMPQKIAPGPGSMSDWRKGISFASAVLPDRLADARLSPSGGPA